MVIGARVKSGFRLFKKHYIRLFTVMAIVVVSVGFASGIGEVENKIKTAEIGLYDSQNISDLYVKSSQITGFSDTEILKIVEKYGEDNVMKSLCMEVKNDGNIYRIIACDFENWTINKPKLLSGENPKETDIDFSGENGIIEVLTERKTNRIKGYNIGENISLSVMGLNFDFTVTGEIFHPLMVYQDDEPSFAYENECLDAVIYINSKNLPIVNDLYITLENRNFNAYSDAYKQTIEENKAEISELLGEDRCAVLSLYENIGLYMLFAYAEKVGLIGIIFIMFFALVTMLVVYSTMSRLLDEERSSIACMKTLGYSNSAILRKYLAFAAVGSVAGGAISYPIGMGLTAILYRAFNIQYYMPRFPTASRSVYYAATYFAIVAVAILFTLFAGFKLVRQKPVKLLAHKVPKPGRRALVERIPFIWNNLSFKYKSSIRNVFLFRSRFYMTVISIMGSTVLVLAGLGLLDNVLKTPNSESILTISVALIIFSALLCALVIYNITNINVSERVREIATLMVLGYNDIDIIGYVFREIFIMSTFGAVLGVPVGLLFIGFVFNLVDFGTVGNVNWWTWMLAPMITLLFGVLAGALLIKRILKTDMNASLKSLE